MTMFSELKIHLYVAIPEPDKPGGGGGNSHMDQRGMLIGSFEFNS